MRKEKVAVALSGGVDSGVAAALMVKAGYQAAGFHIRLWQEGFHAGDGVVNFRNKCCDLESLETARKAAHQLEIPFYVVDFEKTFKKRVVDYFLEEYAAGRTPNPCVRCNRFIKFGELLKYVRQLGYDYLATGHYSRLATEIKNEKLKIKNDNPKFKIYHLLPGIDKTKDQSYFLYSLTQFQLAHVLFPVGEYTKKQVVSMAKKWKLPVYSQPESQEICFFPESDYRPFLRRQISEKIVPGEVVDTKGRVIGKHKGLPLYTIGQRKGLGVNGSMVEWLDGSGAIPPFYVVAKDEKKNQLIVGFGKETERKEFWVKDVNWINSKIELGIRNQELRCDVRIRHGGELLRCKVRIVKPAPKVSRRFHLRGGTDRPPRVKVVLGEAERGIAPGQAAVFYKKYKVQSTKCEVETFEALGGGVITQLRP